TGNLGVAVCDVVGKGVRASLLMASIRASLRAHAASIYELSEVIRRVNADLCADTDANDFASLFYGVLDTRARRLTYANAGHTPPLLLRNGQVTYLGAGGGLIGIDPAARWRHESISGPAGGSSASTRPPAGGTSPSPFAPGMCSSPSPTGCTRP
ncbi:MAG: PP2C family protein-serine/threonine phosphatase, partial [Planctomycetota bacterium]|nr:PP2C family protein-serine/threonine phosphatase [Planctomycetota bacterium]